MDRCAVARANRHYNLVKGSALLCWTDAATRESSSVLLSKPTLLYCEFTLTPTGDLYITGGLQGTALSNEATAVYTKKDYGLVSLPPMSVARVLHASVSYSHYVYVIGGGANDDILTHCERFSLSTTTWEPLPALLTPLYDSQAVVFQPTSSIFVVGSYDEPFSTLIQELSLVAMTWRVLEISLPLQARVASCFRVSDVSPHIYLIQERKLVVVSPMDSTAQLAQSLCYNLYGSLGKCLFYEGLLYCSADKGVIRCLEVGSLS
jgi:hypothetical protein